MTNIQIFNNTQFGQVRAVTIDGEPWFVGKDVAEKLGYSDAFGALKKHVDYEDKQNCQNDSFESPRGMTIINESGLYSLTFPGWRPSSLHGQPSPTACTPRWWGAVCVCTRARIA